MTGTAARRDQRAAVPFAVIGGRRLHYLRFHGETPGAIPIILTNGWPSTFWEMVELARRLAH